MNDVDKNSNNKNNDTTTTNDTDENNNNNDKLERPQHQRKDLVEWDPKSPPVAQDAIPAACSTLRALICFMISSTHFFLVGNDLAFHVCFRFYFLIFL